MHTHINSGQIEKFVEDCTHDPNEFDSIVDYFCGVDRRNEQRVGVQRKNKRVGHVRGNSERQPLFL